MQGLSILKAKGTTHFKVNKKKKHRQV